MVLLVASPARAQEPRYFYCYVPDRASGITWTSDTQPVGPVAERAGYGDAFVRFLQAQQLVPAAAAGFCVMRATSAQIDTGRANLPAGCADCGTAAFRRIAWRRTSGASSETSTPPPGGSRRPDCAPPPRLPPPRPGTYRPRVIDARCGPADEAAVQPSRRAPAPPLPPEIAANLPGDAYVQLLPPSEDAFLQLHTQFFLCGDSIYLSYALVPVPVRRIATLRFRGTVDGNFGPSVPFDVTARVEPGQAMGCAHQKLLVGPLAAYEAQLIQHQYTDGRDVHSRQTMVRTLLGGFHVAALPAPWPAGAIGAPAP